MENLVDSQLLNTKDDSINLYANIDTNCNEYDPIYSWQTIDTTIPITTADSIQLTSKYIKPNKTHTNHSSMEINQKYVPNQCTAYKSLPNILLSSKSNKIFLLHPSKSMPSCLKFFQEQFPYYKRISMLNILNIEKKKIIQKKKSNPTIGDLLGDNDLFHYHYHHQYSSSRSKRKRYQYQSYPHSSHTSIHVQHGRRKQQRSNYFNRIKDSETIQSIPPTSHVYINPTAYSCTPLPNYCSCYYSNMISYCPCLMSDFYTGLYQQDLCYETSQNHYQRIEQQHKDEKTRYL